MSDLTNEPMPGPFESVGEVSRFEHGMRGALAVLLAGGSIGGAATMLPRWRTPDEKARATHFAFALAEAVRRS